MDFVVVVEIPQGSRNKYEMDHDLGRIRLDRMLFTSTRYPADYGYVEGTLGLDGEPLDALVLGGDPTFPGVLIRCRALGMFRMNDQQGEDDKVLCVPATDPRMKHLHELGDVFAHDLREIQHFFEVYKDLEPGKSFDGASWLGRSAAEQEIAAARTRRGACSPQRRDAKAAPTHSGSAPDEL
ncbi:inorganic diphosphatase [Streptacidiphilus jiangxiensis]|uniref:Inorganic pyrophosphatase n=1 Tax=Streptacidiphilus jiangxiensis TaxID=235985 RepID=A0A1H7ZVC9_STRJI|nr:inorganic diphosphatase [Streptacidiphilus jiangxiensis]SEM62216.1 inorganic pyrophosphatase [Streptacidiphilus jiangxiensis]